MNILVVSAPILQTNFLGVLAGGRKLVEVKGELFPAFWM